jgi:hypothetical protein
MVKVAERESVTVSCSDADSDEVREIVDVVVTDPRVFDCVADALFDAEMSSETVMLCVGVTVPAVGDSEREIETETLSDCVSSLDCENDAECVDDVDPDTCCDIDSVSEKVTEVVADSDTLNDVDTDTELDEEIWNDIDIENERDSETVVETCCETENEAESE